MAYSNSAGIFILSGLSLLVHGDFQFYKNVIKEINLVELQSTIICPNCGFQKRETMPTNACQIFYECESCKTSLRPKDGDCCIYCSYGTVACPSIQINQDCC